MMMTMLLLVLSMQVGQDISLFDGNTLTGWVLENTTSDKIVVKDGVIRIEQGSGTKPPLTGRVMTQGRATAAKELSCDPEVLRRVLKPTGAWQTYEIQCIGPRVAVRVNGVLISEVEVARLSGHIGLQGETGIVEFRNISVREIAAR